jgi:hypothetical protein
MRCFTFSLALLFLAQTVFASELPPNAEPIPSGPVPRVAARNPVAAALNSEITDPRLRAEAGSSSRLSIKTSLNYDGPQINNLGSPNTPDPDHLAGRHKTAMTGSVGLRYRIDVERALTFGTGIAAVTPFQTLKRFDINNLYFGYDITERVHGFQTHLAPTVSIITVPENNKVGQKSSFGLVSGSVYDFGASKWAASFDARLAYIFYDRAYMKSDRRAPQANVSLIPGLKYRFTDKLNGLVTIGFSYWNPRSLGDQLALDPKTVDGRFGVSYSPRKTIYLNPYITTYPGRLALNTTSLNFSTIFSIH